VIGSLPKFCQHTPLRSLLSNLLVSNQSLTMISALNIRNDLSRWRLTHRLTATTGETEAGYGPHPAHHCLLGTIRSCDYIAHKIPLDPVSI
jgi:hypothetical protein